LDRRVFVENKGRMGGYEKSKKRIYGEKNLPLHKEQNKGGGFEL